MTIDTSTRRLAIVAPTGAAVAVAVGVYGNLHDPTGPSLVTLSSST